MDDCGISTRGIRSALKRLLASMTSLLVALSVLQGESIAQQLDPLDAVKLRAYATADAIRCADLRGTYEILGEDGTTKAKTRFRIRFADDKFLTEMEPTKGFRYDRIVAVADETGVCEAVFSDRIHPNGCHGDLLERRKLVERPPIGNYPAWLHEGQTPFWLQGPLVFYHILNSVPFDNEHTRAHRTKDGLHVGTYRPSWDELGEFAGGEFEARPEYGNNLSQFSVTDKRGSRTVSSIKWKKSNGCWFIEQFEEKKWYGDLFRGHTLIRFSHVQLNKELPTDLFSIASLGLVDGTRILDRHPNERAVAFNYVSQEPKGETIRVEATRQRRYVRRVDATD